MRKELEETLFKRFPSFFRGRKKRSLMAFLMHDDGWYELVYNLCEDIETILKEECPEFLDKFIVLEVKEKFGGLRFYIGGIHKKVAGKIFNRIEEAERMSYHICEICGREGKLRVWKDFIWYKTLCDSCSKDEWIDVELSKLKDKCDRE